MGANVLPGRKVCSKCVTGPLDELLSKASQVIGEETELLLLKISCA